MSRMIEPRWALRLRRDRLALESLEVEEDLDLILASWSVLTLDEPIRWSIRLPVPPRPCQCPLCGIRFLAAGPTGHADERPVCDPCLLESAPPLGLVLALSLVARVFGALVMRSRSESWQALRELGIFARVYARYAARWGPLRTFDRSTGDKPAG